jgi:hypothetical protein
MGAWPHRAILCIALPLALGPGRFGALAKGTQLYPALNDDPCDEIKKHRSSRGLTFTRQRGRALLNLPASRAFLSSKIRAWRFTNGGPKRPNSQQAQPRAEARAIRAWRFWLPVGSHVFFVWSFASRIYAISKIRCALLERYRCFDRRMFILELQFVHATLGTVLHYSQA